jgi:uncharacterized protein YegJ (DUF2314 family)
MERTMKHLSATAIMAIWLGLLGLVLPSFVLPTQAEVVFVPTADPAMNAAIAEAKATLPGFFQRLGKPQPGDEGFAVKIYFKTRTGDGEHIWANKIEVAGNSVSATISNEPRDIAGLKAGQRLTVPMDRITDWMFMRAGKIHGGQTIRAAIPTLPKAQADQYKAMLAPE